MELDGRQIARFAEEIDPHTGGHLGDFPQAFTLVALVQAVIHLIDHDRRQAAER